MEPISMKELLQTIADLRARTYRLLEFREESKPGSPARESEIQGVEIEFAVRLPPSYRLFLSIHNGWEHWSGDVALLSTAQLLKGKYADRVREWKAKNALAAPVSSAIVIGFSLFAGEQILLDVSPQAYGAVVVWDRQEVERFPDFQGYLENFARILQEEYESDLME